MIDHATYADDAALEAIAERGIFVVPSLHQPHRLLTTGTAHGKTPEYLETLEFQAEVENTLRILPLMVEMGIPIVAGDDFGFAWTPHGRYAEELETYVSMAGIPAPTVLTWATANGARLAGRGGEAGTVQPGGWPTWWSPTATRRGTSRCWGGPRRSRWCCWAGGWSPGTPPPTGTAGRPGSPDAAARAGPDWPHRIGGDWPQPVAAPLRTVGATV